MEAYAPDVIVLELGMDTLAGDPLTHLRMTNNIVVEILEPLLQFNCPLLVAGGGGYHVENTVRGWALAWRTCCGEDEERFWDGHGRRHAGQHGMGGRFAGPDPGGDGGTAPGRRTGIAEPRLKTSSITFSSFTGFAPIPGGRRRRPAGSSPPTNTPNQTEPHYDNTHSTVSQPVSTSSLMQEGRTFPPSREVVQRALHQRRAIPENVRALDQGPGRVLARTGRHARLVQIANQGPQIHLEHRRRK